MKELKMGYIVAGLEASIGNAVGEFIKYVIK